MRRTERQDLADLESRSRPQSFATATTRRLGTISTSNTFTRTRASFLIDLDDGGTVVAINLGVHLPSSGDRVVLDLLAGEWVFSDGQ